MSQSSAEAFQHEILVADDEEIVRRRWKDILEKADFRVRLACDGEQALDEVYRAVPDLVIVDLNMPKMDGNEVCNRLKSSQHTESIPVIMVTASDDPEHKIACLRSGANDYLVKDELRKSENTELVERVRNALKLRVDNRDGNPLTGLPGNSKIERELTRRLREQQPMAFLYVDIDNFKAFNDYYGYRHGDEAILKAATVMRQAVVQHGDSNDFIGHVGGDDFVIMTEPARATLIAEAVVTAFDQSLQQLYDPETYAAGGFKIEGRTGRVEEFRLMSLTIALVSNAVEPLVHPAQVNDRAMELKKFGKAQPGSYIARDRRGGR